MKERKNGKKENGRRSDFRTLLQEDFLERLLMSERSLAGHSHWSPQLWIKTPARDSMTISTNKIYRVDTIFSSLRSEKVRGSQRRSGDVRGGQRISEVVREGKRRSDMVKGGQKR